MPSKLWTINAYTENKMVGVENWKKNKTWKRRKEKKNREIEKYYTTKRKKKKNGRKIDMTLLNHDNIFLCAIILRELW